MAEEGGNCTASLCIHIGGGQLIQKLASKDNFIGLQHQGVGSGTTKVLYIIGLHNKQLSGHLIFYYVMKITFELSHHFT